MHWLWAASAAILMCLAISGMPVAAQEASGELGEITLDLLFEVTLPPSVMSDVLERINTGGLTVAPGLEADIGSDNRGLSGVACCTSSPATSSSPPMVDSLALAGRSGARRLTRDHPGGRGRTARTGRPHLPARRRC